MRGEEIKRRMPLSCRARRYTNCGRLRRRRKTQPYRQCRLRTDSTRKPCFESLKNFISQDRIEIEKKSEKRRNRRTVCISDGMTVKSRKQTRENDSVFVINLPCNSENNVGVNLLMKAFSEFTGGKICPITVKRVAFLKKTEQFSNNLIFNIYYDKIQN